jgi:NAD(P)-dependent dehydrogenase (short-subunit alcohol dehydrogenase family)
MSMPSTKRPLCLVTGVGPGTGSAIARRFDADGYQVAILARNRPRLEELAAELTDPLILECDVTDYAALDAAIAECVAVAVPKAVVYNAVGGTFGTYLDIDPVQLARNFEINVMALLHTARTLVPMMAGAGGGAFVATGNTSAYRGKANFAAFAPTKAAQRILLESIAREAGPQGVHCGYIAIDAVIDLDWTRKMMPDKPDDFFCQPADIADEVYRIVHQPKTAWSFDSVIRPFGEPW